MYMNVRDAYAELLKKKNDEKRNSTNMKIKLISEICKKKPTTDFKSYHRLC